MKNVLVINGPNLNLLGRRDNKHYGTASLETINVHLREIGKEHHTKLLFFQSNHEGELIDYIQKHSTRAHGILINLGALTHYSYALRDALQDTKLPIVAVHLSDITTREKFRKTDVIEDIVLTRIMGKKEKSYLLGLIALIAHMKKS